MLARSIRAGSSRPACRHAASSAARRWSAEASSSSLTTQSSACVRAPSAAGATAASAESSLAPSYGGRRALANAARCSSTLANSEHFSASGSANDFAAHHDELISAYQYHPQRIPRPSPQIMGPSSSNLLLTNNYSHPMQMRSYHSMVPSSAITAAARRTSREMRSAILSADPHASAAFDETMTRIIMRALFSTNPSPNVNSDDSQDGKDGANSASSTSMAAKAVSASEAKLNGSSAEQPAAKTVTERKKPNAPKDMVVQHATATDAFVSFVKSVPDKTKDLLLAAAKALASLLAKTPGVLWYYVTHPWNSVTSSSNSRRPPRRRPITIGWEASSSRPICGRRGRCSSDRCRAPL